MPRLWNVENSWVKSFAVAQMASNVTTSAAWAGVTTADIIMGRGTNTAFHQASAYISAADVVTFGPTGGAPGAVSTVAQTLWLQLMKAPTTDVLGGSL